MEDVALFSLSHARRRTPPAARTGFMPSRVTRRMFPRKLYRLPSPSADVEVVAIPEVRGAPNGNSLTATYICDCFENSARRGAASRSISANCEDGPARCDSYDRDNRSEYKLKRRKYTGRSRSCGRQLLAKPKVNSRKSATWRIIAQFGK